MYTAPQIVYAALNGLPQTRNALPGRCRLCGGNLIGEPVFWPSRAKDKWTSENLARDKSSAYICEPCSWAYGRPQLMTAAMGSNRGFVATVNEFRGFNSAASIIRALETVPAEPSVWLLKTGVIQKPVLFLPAVSYPPYLRVTFVEGDSCAREFIFRPEQLIDRFNEFSALPAGQRQKLARRSPADELVNWLVNVRQKEEKTNRKENSNAS